jgi:hypothetical protein
LLPLYCRTSSCKTPRPLRHSVNESAPMREHPQRVQAALAFNDTAGHGVKYRETIVAVFYAGVGSPPANISLRCL